MMLDSIEEARKAEDLRIRLAIATSRNSKERALIKKDLYDQTYSEKSRFRRAPVKEVLKAVMNDSGNYELRMVPRRG